MEIGGHVQRLSSLKEPTGLILLQGCAVSSRCHVDGIRVSDPYSTASRMSSVIRVTAYIEPAKFNLHVGPTGSLLDNLVGTSKECFGDC
jgi:hypothetical protein